MLVLTYSQSANLIWFMRFFEIFDSEFGSILFEAFEFNFVNPRIRREGRKSDLSDMPPKNFADSQCLLGVGAI